MKYQPRIGLEIHAELKTKTKLFCDSPNNPDEKHPNLNICPVCTGQPGVLPLINKEAIKSVLRAGLAVSGNLANHTCWDRKNYFYPDLPKGYQISQYKYPLVEGGSLNGVKITRIHLEEDTGRLVHKDNATLVDFNRAGVPLMELVTEADITSAIEACAFAEELRLLLRYLEISDADMEKGQMRIEANISLSGENSKKWGTKVEVKNLNSFKAVEAAINYEINRQAKKLDDGESVAQETRGWDENKQKTFSQRSKEEAHDYRYFPEPDLPEFIISEMEEFQNLEETIPELPWQKRERLKKEYGLGNEHANILVNEKKLTDFFEKAVSESKADDKKIAAQKISDLTFNYLTSDLVGIMKEKFLTIDDLLVTPENFADLIEMLAEEKISSRAGKDILREMAETGAEPHVLIEKGGLQQVNDEESIKPLVDKVMKENPHVVEDYKKGKKSSVQFLVGAIMKETKGKTNPQKAKEILEKLLD